MMATYEIKIKTEPLDDEDYPIIKEEELIIKSEPDDDELIEECPETPDPDFQCDLLVPKEEPIDYDSSMENVVNVYEKEDTSFCQVITTQERFPCEACGRDFASTSGLQKHKNYRCRKLISSKQLHNASSPNSIIHTRAYGQKPFCRDCGDSFGTPRQLNRHITSKKCSKKLLTIEADQLKIKTEPLDEEFAEESIPQPPKESMHACERRGDNLNQSIPVDNPFPQVPMVKVKAEFTEMDKPNPLEFVKVEPKEEPEETKTQDCDDDSNSTMDLLLEELFERKIRSVAKQKAQSPTNQQNKLNNSVAKQKTKSQVNQQPTKVQSIGLLRKGNQNKPNPEVSPSLPATDFEDVISLNTLIAKAEPQSDDDDDIEKLLIDEESADDFSQHSTLDKSQQAPDFETLITSNTLPNFQNQNDVIEDLKEEYRKAKALKIAEEWSDESSQLSSIPAPPQDSKEPGSVYLTLGSDIRLYTQAVRKLSKDYRYIWICPSCPRRYVQRHAFVKHLMSSHQQTSEQLGSTFYELKPEPSQESVAEHTFCHLCHVTLADSASLQKHRKELHNEDTTTKMQFKCYKCGKFCSTRNTLADHVQADCGKAPQYGCDVCGKKFYTKSTLNLHKTMHTGELPYQCGYCEKRFRTRGQMTVHVRTHTGERPFPCKVCARRFTHRETLIAHLSRHIDMKRYKCYGCNTFFSCISGLKTHRMTRMSTCGQFKLNARPVGPRVRVIKGNVIFEPQPKINPYSRDKDDSEKIDQKNPISRESDQDQENINTIVKLEPHSMMVDS